MEIDPAWRASANPESDRQRAVARNMDQLSDSERMDLATRRLCPETVEQVDLSADQRTPAPALEGSHRGWLSSL